MSELPECIPEGAKVAQHKDNRQIATNKTLSFILGVMFLIQCLSGDPFSIFMAVLLGGILILYALIPVQRIPG